ncbi:MAG: hypothetical protein HY868_21000 [Chloroflexi bacterium]|nr:hypothetical protein [Chloroflexota bacterium]
MMTPRKTMLSPTPGFTARVMTRIEAYERARARRRAVIGVIVLVVAALVVFALIAVSVAAWVFALADQAGTVASGITALVAVFENARGVLDAFRIAGTTITRNVNEMVWVAYALIALTMTMVWTRVAIGFPRFASISLQEEKR